jgi:hypothetical protein
VTVILIFVVGMAIIAGLVWVMVRFDRAQRRRIQRQREAWKAGGSVGPAPGQGCSGGSGGISGLG